jgi:hypothetical protein
MNRAFTLFFALSIYARCTCVAYAGLLEDFQREYPGAAAKLEKAYSHSRAYGTHVRFDSNGKQSSRTSFEIACRDLSIRNLDTVLESDDPRSPVGSISAFGGTAEKFFGIHRFEGAQTYTIDQFGPYEDFKRTVRISLAPLTAPYCYREESVADQLADPAVKWQSARLDVLDNEDVVRVDFVKPLEKRFVHEGYIYFHRENWAIAGYHFTTRQNDTPAEQTDRNLTAEGRVKYSEMKPVPKVSQVKFWRVRPNKRTDETTDDVTKLEFLDVPQDQFTLKAFDLTEPDKPIIYGK